MIENKSNKPFFDHLEELRSRIIKCFITVIFFSILGYIYSNSIISFLIKPVQELDVTFQVLGPVGDIVEEWKLKGAWIQDATFGDLDNSSSDPIEIQLTLRYDYAILQF